MQLETGNSICQRKRQPSWRRFSTAFAVCCSLVLFHQPQLSLFPAVAFAEGGGGGGGGGCPSCGGGEGEGGGGGGGGGSKAAEILAGIAAIIAPIAAAVAQVQAAKERANADKFIARTAANAAIEQTDIQAKTTEKLSENQLTLARENTAATKQIAEENQKASTERLTMQLGALQSERTALADERREIRQIEEQRANQQIAFAKQQADETLRLQKLQLFTNAAQQNLAPGGGGSLAVENSFSDRVGQAGPDLNPGTALASNNAGGGGANGIGSVTDSPSRNRTVPASLRGIEEEIAQSAFTTNFGKRKFPPKAPTAFRAVASNSRGVKTTSLSSTSSSGRKVTKVLPKPNRKISVRQEKVRSSSALLSSIRADIVKGIAVFQRGFAKKYARGFRQGMVRRGVSAQLSIEINKRRGLVGGSTREQRWRVESGLPRRNSGLRDFAKAVNKQFGSRGRRHRSGGDHQGHGHGHGAGHGRR